MQGVILILILLYMAHTMPVISVYYPPIIYAGVTVTMSILMATKLTWRSFRNIVPFMVLPLANLLFKEGSIISYEWWAGVLQLFAFPLIALYLLQNCDKKTVTFVFCVYVFFQVVISITTIIGLNQFPEACRQFGHGDFSQTAEFVLYRSLNIGGWGFIYNLTLSIPLMVFVWRYGKKVMVGHNLISWLSLIFLLVSVYTIYRSQYATALLFSVLALALSMIKKELRTSTMIVVVVISVLLFMALRQPLISVLDYVSSQISGEVIQERFESMSQTLQGQDVDDNSDMAARQYFWTISLDEFFLHPFGAWGNARVGGHSTWLDALARYGLLVIVFFVLTIKGMNNYILRPIRNTRTYNPILVSFLVLMIMGFFNPSYSTDFLLFIVPLFLYAVTDINLLKQH